MHYDSTAFSRNGRHTIETVVDGYTDVIGSSTDLSALDIVKVRINESIVPIDSRSTISEALCGPYMSMEPVRSDRPSPVHSTVFGAALDPRSLSPTVCL